VCAGAEHPGDCVTGERLKADPAAEEPGEQRLRLVAAQPAPGLEADAAAPEAGEQGSRCMAAQSTPGSESGEWVSLGVGAAGDGDGLTVSFLVGLGAADRDQKFVRFLLDVEQGQGDQLGAAHRGGVAEQDDRGITGPDGVVRSMLLRICWTSLVESGRASRRGAVP